MTLREATAEKHKIAEQHPFNQKLFKGILGEEDYLFYLTQLFQIINTIEDIIDLPPNLLRLEAVDSDMTEIENRLPENLNNYALEVLEETDDYCSYLNSLSKQEIFPHVYLNYMALMFGGQMLKKVVPGSGKIYNFKNMPSLIEYIRSNQKDEWAEEVNKGFDYIINIYNALDQKNV